MSTLAGLVLSNSGVVPCDHRAYVAVNRFLLPMSIPLLLFSADLKRMVRLLGPMMLAFLLGSAATIAGGCNSLAPKVVLLALQCMGSDALFLPLRNARRLQAAALGVSGRRQLEGTAWQKPFYFQASTKAEAVRLQ